MDHVVLNAEPQQPVRAFGDVLGPGVLGLLAGLYLVKIVRVHVGNAIADPVELMLVLDEQIGEDRRAASAGYGEEVRDARRHQYYLHNFLISQPDFNYHNPDVQDWALKTLRFWLDRGVDGFRFDTVNYFFHDPKFLDNPPDLRPRKKPAANPYDMQDHRFDKNRPETLTWLERIRHLLDEYGAAAVGEVGEGYNVQS